jgi:hypothetical protein
MLGSSELTACEFPHSRLRASVNYHDVNYQSLFSDDIDIADTHQYDVSLVAPLPYEVIVDLPLVRELRGIRLFDVILYCD